MSDLLLKMCLIASISQNNLQLVSYPLNKCKIVGKITEQKSTALLETELNYSIAALACY